MTYSDAHPKPRFGVQILMAGNDTMFSDIEVTLWAVVDQISDPEQAQIIMAVHTDPKAAHSDAKSRNAAAISDTASIHPDDPWHVILDALNCLEKDVERAFPRSSAQRDDRPPWQAYDADATDPKTTKQGYLNVIARARRIAEDKISYGDAGLLNPQAKGDAP